MRFATVREISRNPTGYIDLKDSVIITKHGKPVRALIALSEEEIEDFVLADALDLKKEAARALHYSDLGKNTPAAKLKKKYR